MRSIRTSLGRTALILGQLNDWPRVPQTWICPGLVAYCMVHDRSQQGNTHERLTSLGIVVGSLWGRYSAEQWLGAMAQGPERYSSIIHELADDWEKHGIERVISQAPGTDDPWAALTRAVVEAAVALMALRCPRLTHEEYTATDGLNPVRPWAFIERLDERSAQGHNHLAQMAQGLRERVGYISKLA